MTIANENAGPVEFVGNGVSFSFATTFRILSDGDVEVVLEVDATGVRTLQVLGVDYSVTGAGNLTANVVMVTPPATGETLSLFLAPPFLQTTDYPPAGQFPSTAHEQALDRLVNLTKNLLYRAERSLQRPDGEAGTPGTFDAETNRIMNLGDPVDNTDATTLQSVNALIQAVVLDPTIAVSPYWGGQLVLATAALSRTGLGSTTIGDALFIVASEAAAQTIIGITAFGQTLTTAADAEAGRLALEVTAELVHRNELANGDFQINQQGKTFNSTTPIAGGNDDASYFSDQWVLLSDGDDVVDIAITAATTSRGSNAAEFEIVTANTQWGFCQFLDNEQTLNLRNAAMSFSIEVEAPDTATLFEAYLIEWTDTADAPTRDVIATYNSTTTAPTLATNWAFIGSPLSISATGTSTTFKLQNVTIPNTANNLAVLVVSLDGVMAATSKVTFGEAQLVRGSTAGRFASRTKVIEWDRCEQWLAMSFPEATFPVQNAGLDGAFHAQGFQDSNTDGTMQYPWLFSHRMVKSPTITTFNPTAASTTWDSITDSNTRPALLIGTSTRGVTIYAVPAGGNNGRQWAIHVQADARF